jgi:hypothetical protein
MNALIGGWPDGIGNGEELRQSGSHLKIINKAG